VASKFALEGLSETLRMEVQPFGIRGVIVEPGQFATELWGTAKALPEQDVEPSYEAICEEWRSLGGKPPPGTADPAAVGVLIADILANPEPALRYPIGPVAGMSAGEWISRHLARS
jgi:NAD(P)-dependent dehydrogenase (short-subunit alcohol dehydrogenase family)